MQVTNKSIRSVMGAIKAGEMILPALQREFVWKRRDIEGLFDSLLQGFPINTLMFWDVKDVKPETMAFYQFLDPDFQESVSVNKVYPIRDNERKIVVIDGQQRLTSLYIAIYGSYTLEKGKNKMFLYLNLDNPLNSNGEDDSLSSTENFYNFKFMSEDNANKLIAKGQHWIRVSEAYSHDFNPTAYIVKKGLQSNQFAMDVIQKLSDVFKRDDILNAYVISDDKDLQHVLNVFVRTNSGGKPLTKGDLLLSVITVNWADNNQGNARDYVQDIISKVSSYGYKVDKDWVLGCMLYVLDREVKLSVSSFDTQTASEIEQKKKSIADSIESACLLLNRYGMLERGLTTKLALYPIVYHIYKYFKGTIKGYTNGVQLPVESGVFVQMRTWLFRAIVKNLFEAGTAETLQVIQAIQRSTGSADCFPLDKIIAAKTKLIVNDDDIKALLHTEKKRAFPVLNIIYSTSKDRAYLSAKTDYDIDHIHAKTLFGNNPADNRFDLVPNLQLLTFDENRSKNAMGLESWWNAKNEGQKTNYLLPARFNAELSAFDELYQAREKWFGAILAEKLEAKESSFAGVTLAEKFIAAVYTKGKNKYGLTWDIHADRLMKLPVNGRLITLQPTMHIGPAVLAFQDLRDEERALLQDKQLAQEHSHELRDHMNNTMIRESVFGIAIKEVSDAQLDKVFAAFDLLCLDSV